MRQLRNFLARIFIRLLAFNLLLVFLPVAGLLYLGVYERELLDAQEHAMVQQGRILAAALSNQGEQPAERARAILKTLNLRTESRLRVFDASGRVLADSSRLGAAMETAGGGERAQAPTPRGWLYRLGTLPYRLYRKIAEPPVPPLETAEFYASSVRLAGPEIAAALDGQYGAATRISTGGQRSVTLYCALPVRDGERVVGGVLVSQSTYRILLALYEVRIGIFRIFLASVGFAALLSLVVSGTIVAPLRRLRDEAAAIFDHRGRLAGRFHAVRRRDEIGDLARSLEELTRRLSEHVRFIESFSADLSHEFKNPLASVRSATEMLEEVEDEESRERFTGIVLKEVARMERLLTVTREITKIDAGIEEEPRAAVDLVGITQEILGSCRLRAADRKLEFRLEKLADKLLVMASPERLAQVIENLLDNAISFSPEGGAVVIAVAPVDGMGLLAVSDEGPGVPPEHLRRVFDRFFTYRPAGGGDAAAGDHAGLGLAIVKAIVDGYGGSVEAQNRHPSGARFEVRIPLVDEG